MATVYRGTIFGDATNHVNNFYTNSTGGNVRIVWYYFHLGSSQRFRFYVGTATPPSPASLGLSTTSPIDYTYYGDATTIRMGDMGNGNLVTGKHYRLAGDNPGGAFGGSGGHLPAELILPAGDKMSLFIPEEITDVASEYYEFALRYNFLEIPE
tara:strand:- start:155 stop:616 length:462 start_codon:yes stop_codon:yes gene_type:complete